VYGFLGLARCRRSCERIAARSRRLATGGCLASWSWPTWAATATPTRYWSTGSTTVEADGERRPRPRLRLPGPDRPLAGAGHRPGLTPERVRAQRRGRRPQRALRARRGRRHCAGGDADGRISAPARVRARDPGRRLARLRRRLLASFDVVVAALHQAAASPGPSSRRASSGAIPARTWTGSLTPAGRMLGERARDDLDLAWDEIFAAAAATGTLLESMPPTTAWTFRRSAPAWPVAAGCRLAIDSDAHRWRSWRAYAGVWPRRGGRGVRRSSSPTRGRGVAARLGRRQAGEDR